MDLLAEARFDQMNRCYKTPVEEFTRKGQSFVVKSFHIDYSRPIFYGTRFNIETWVEEMKGPIAEIKFRFLKLEDDSCYASGSVKYVFIDLASKRLVDFSEELRKIYLGL